MPLCDRRFGNRAQLRVSRGAAEIGLGDYWCS